MVNYSNHWAGHFWVTFVKPVLIHSILSLFFLLYLFLGFTGQASASQYTSSAINYHALLISVTEYSNGWPDLPTRVDQVDTLADVLKKNNYRVERLINPDYSRLKNGIDSFLVRHSKDNDRVFLFFTGHCFQDDDARSSLIPSDAPLPGRSNSFTKGRFLPIVPILVSIEQQGIKEAVVAIDGSISINSRQILMEYERNSYVFLRNKGYLPYTIIGAGTAGEAENAHSSFIDLLVRTYEKFRSHKKVLLEPFLKFVLQKGKFNSWQMPWFQTGGQVSSLDGHILIDKNKSAVTQNDGSSTLRIRTSQHSATVAIDGVAETDFANGVNLPAGDYRIEYSSDETTQERYLTLRSGEIVELFIYNGKSAPESSFRGGGQIPGDEEEDFVDRDLIAKRFLDINWVRVPSGQFSMGSNRYMEGPIHAEYIKDDFYIMDAEVSVKQYLHFLEEIGELSSYTYYDPLADDDLPATFVSWHDASKFAKWVSEKIGRTCRLPSEAEWEYVAQMGMAGRSLPIVFPSKTKKAEVPVQLAWRNSLGIAGMPGNVWEWCFDCWREKYNKEIEVTNTFCSNRVIRGGSWRNRSNRISATSRNGVASNTQDAIIGFRLIMEQ